jgi:hypothetical protein
MRNIKQVKPADGSASFDVDVSHTFNANQSKNYHIEMICGNNNKSLKSIVECWRAGSALNKMAADIRAASQ